MHINLVLEAGNHIMKGDISVDGDIPKVHIERENTLIMDTTTKQPHSTTYKSTIITTLQSETTTKASN
jgi:hypothetical protein